MAIPDNTEELKRFAMATGEWLRALIRKHHVSKPDVVAALIERLQLKLDIEDAPIPTPNWYYQEVLAQVLNALGIDETSARRICEDDEPLYDNYEAYDIEISKFQGVVNTFGAQGCWETVSGWAMSIPPEEVLPVAVDHRLAALLASCRPE
ncbi:hypothetical protein [Ectopseudomonas mendocina]|uniref:Uncharacterized protein n=1 Tax=Ectopseudomonas mendocina S5.2 TaxID=1225174 RepID=A0ABM5W3E8_ECTME|nr:hypothetical protein [Pseudomonas mendocina]ALN21789.1 hypothetical protein DW68_024230 [Pseudomonas mendocina S5.2]KER98154.1 hypothetical protein HN51_25495 [Pseudomonas mendocina]